MKRTSLEDILGDFNPTEPARTGALKDGAPVTIWLPQEHKERYDRIQKSSGRKFSKKARDTLIALIELAEARAS